MFGAYYGVYGRASLFGSATQIGDCMTSESDSTSRRRPPTIDLTATEVGTEKPASAQDAGPDLKTDAPESAPARSSSIMKPALAGAAIGAVVIAAGIAGLDIAGYLPLRQPTTQAIGPAPAADNKAIADITAQLNKIQGAISAPQTDPDSYLPFDCRRGCNKVTQRFGYSAEHTGRSDRRYCTSRASAGEVGSRCRRRRKKHGAGRRDTRRYRRSDQPHHGA